MSWSIIPLRDFAGRVQIGVYADGRRLILRLAPHEIAIADSLCVRFNALERRLVGKGQSMRYLTTAEELLAATLARWFRLKSAIAAAHGRRAERLRVELAEVEAEITALEAQIAEEAQTGAGGGV